MDRLPSDQISANHSFPTLESITSGLWLLGLDSTHGLNYVEHAPDPHVAILLRIQIHEVRLPFNILSQDAVHVEL